MYYKLYTRSVLSIDLIYLIFAYVCVSILSARFGFFFILMKLYLILSSFSKLRKT